VIAALKDCNRLPCNAHLIATVLRNTFDFNKEQKKSFLFQNAKEVYLCIEACKRIVVYIKRSGRNLKLARTVKLMCDTRWNTLVNMLESVLASLPEILDLLIKNNETSKLEGWNAEIATELVNFLVPFRTVSVELQAKKTPTINVVLIRYHDLLKHCVVDSDKDHQVS